MLTGVERTLQRGGEGTPQQLAPVLDVFQSAYKPKLRFFAALPLLYRFVIWFLFSTLSAVQRISGRWIALTFVFIVILAIHSLVQPYRDPKHNYIETLYLVNLVLISQLAYVRLSFIRSWVFSVLTYLTYPLIFLPMLVYVVYYFWKCQCCKRYRAACFKKVERNRRESAQSEDLQAPTSSDVYFDVDEEEQMNQEDSK